MFDIPMGARHIVIEENETSPHIIGECCWKLLNRVTGFFTVISLVGKKNRNFIKCIQRSKYKDNLAEKTRSAFRDGIIAVEVKGK